MGVCFFMQIGKRCSCGYKHLFVCFYGLGHSTLQGGQKRRRQAEKQPVIDLPRGNSVVQGAVREL